MNKIAVFTTSTNPSVCSSMMAHVNMMADIGNELTLVVYSKANLSYFGKCKYRILYFSTLKEFKKIICKYSFDKVWTTTSLEVLELVLLGIKLPIYLWMQGDPPAESYMKHHSLSRKFLLQKIVAFSLRKVSGIIYVSTAMKEYYETQYTITPANNIIVPCLSQFEIIPRNIKRIPNSFVYIGGLSVWQCFDQILSIYKQIRTENSVFHIITYDTNEANKWVNKIIGDTKHIEIYSISDRSKIPEILSQFQYGFLIRQHDIVNLVSSPIKFLEYLSCGVNVIITDAIPSYAKIIEQYNIGTVIKSGEQIKLNNYNAEAQYIYGELFNRNLYLKQYDLLLNNKTFDRGQEL